jgi:eukaryotic-like serine/threonine-protein kinase
MTMTQTWNDLEGVSIAGRYWLKQCLGSTPDDAWYLIRFDADRDAAVRVIRADVPFADAQLETWREVLAIDHPHVVRLLDAGRADAAGIAVIYAVCEYPDDFLAGALAHRPLTTAEAADVLRACLSALGHLHACGLAHGAVDPAHIMAIGDRIKLPSDPVRRDGAPAPCADPSPSEAPEVVAGRPVTATSDMWSLGMTLIEILTRTRPVLDSGAEVPFLPEPFGTIGRNTLRHDPRDRWTVADVEAHLAPPPVVVLEPQPEPEPEPELEPVPVPEPTPAPRSLPLKWVPVVGLIAAAILSVLFLRHPAEIAAPPPVVHPAPLAAPPKVPVTPAASPRPSTGSAVWRVVAYEYHKREQADKKARALNEKRPAWRAEVFAPKGNRAPYFVSLGGRMTLADAEKLRREAHAKGLPRDTFIRNFAN